ncbi:MAG: phosphoribosylformylglycinamidine synthase subunit PurS [Candidatus Omnitrophica bacterium]|nr:phosphoribosylformylglycinamidine synthase subunit PurS [Candidatus Omnitrophota bacterium]
MRARIHVTLKKSVLDPQGKAVQQALSVLGFREVRDVRVGKYIELELEEGDKLKAEERLREMSERLLANLVIEEYALEMDEEE